jgi:hypothetical protein
VSLMFGDEDAKLTPLKCSEMNKWKNDLYGSV